MTVPSIAAVIPTRDRSALAMDAVRSLLDQDCPIEIFVSDNSPLPDHALREFCGDLANSPLPDHALREFCGDLAHERVTYMRPPSSLVQASHWDWAVRQAMERSTATHLTVHYDRKISKPHHLDMLQSVGAKWPELVISWSHDYVADIPPPMRLWQPPWTGNVYELTTSRMTELTAEGRASAIPSHALPLFSNCLVPRTILAEIIGRFGTLCDSTTPDSCFAFRFAALYERYLHFDRPLGIIYAAHRSSGFGYLRGSGSDWEDFQKAWGDRPWLDAAPIPGINVGLNMLYHEYELVRRATGEQFPPIDRGGYLDDVGSGLRLVRDAGARAALRRALQNEGWRGSDARGRVRAFVRHTLLGFLDERLGIRLPNVTGRVFRDDETALRHALSHPRRRQKHARHLAILAPVQVGTT